MDLREVRGLPHLRLSIHWTRAGRRWDHATGVVMSLFAGVAALVVMLVLFLAAWRTRRRRRVSVGPGAAGAFYDLLDRDRRAGIEIIVEERAAHRDPEDADADLPQLERRTGSGRPGPARSRQDPQAGTHGRRRVTAAAWAKDW